MIRGDNVHVEFTAKVVLMTNEMTPVTVCRFRQLPSKSGSMSRDFATRYGVLAVR